MKHLTVLQSPTNCLEHARYGLRAAVCSRCSARPINSESLGAHVPWPCESRCELFKGLPGLLRIANCVDPMVGSFQRIVERHLDRLAESPNECVTTPTRSSVQAHPWIRHKKRIVLLLRNVLRM